MLLVADSLPVRGTYLADESELEPGGESGQLRSCIESCIGGRRIGESCIGGRRIGESCIGESCIGESYIEEVGGGRWCNAELCGSEVLCGVLCEVLCGVPGSGVR